MGRQLWFAFGIALTTLASPCGALTWPEARAEYLLQSPRPGVTSYGFANLPPEARAPSMWENGWYRKIATGTTRVWKGDANGNGRPDPDEIESRDYALWHGAELRPSHHLENLAQYGVRFDAARRVDDLRRYIPDARPVDVGRGGIVYGRYCVACSDRLELQVAVALYLNVRGGHGGWFTDPPTGWGTALLDKEPLTAVLDAARAKLGDAAAELARAALRGWDDWLDQRVSDGPGLHGLFTRDLRPYYPTRAELGPAFIINGGDTGWLAERPGGPRCDLYLDLRAMPYDLSGPRDAPVTKARAQFAESSASEKTQPTALAGADEAALRADATGGTVRFRHGNVLGCVRFGFDETDKQRQVPAFARGGRAGALEAEPRRRRGPAAGGRWCRGGQGAIPTARQFRHLRHVVGRGGAAHAAHRRA